MSKKFEHTLAFHCGPAILGIKASNLINLFLADYPNILDEIKHLNKIFNPYYYFMVLSKKNGRILILVFQLEALKKAVLNTDSLNFLVENGYPSKKNIFTLIKYLKKRLATSCDFPHEIGVFLGYDLDDTIAFLNKDKKCLYTGYWKVYSDLEKKLQTFLMFTNCRNNLLEMLSKGFSLEGIMERMI